MQVVKPSPALIALKPRQLLLSSSSSSNSAMKKTQEAPSLNPHQNSLLLLSVAQFLQRKSFSKTLKKFLSEAQIQKNDLTGSSLDLEQMCFKYLAMSESEVDDKSIKPKKIEEQVSHEAAKESATEPAKKEKEKKKKKIKLDESHVDSVERPSEPLGGVEDKTKDKKKKKNKVTSDALVGNASDISLEDKTSKSKKKKRKDVSEHVEEGKSNDDENGISKVDSTITDDKSSKKRKRLDSEVQDSQPLNENATEDSKRRKTETTQERGADKQLHEQENGNIEKNGKHSEQKSSKKQQNGSAQPKKPFQRVNVDEVVFADSRLEDNSYWAKDGAEIGYGAKAQEVLGQVKGRDFRHEKTKKKRGSYRGGQIDFSSHSVKFNYSDEE